MSGARATRVGWGAFVFAVIVPLAWALRVASFAAIGEYARRETMLHADKDAAALPWLALIAIEGVFVVHALIVLWRARRVADDAPGRTRVRLMAGSGALAALFSIGAWSVPLAYPLMPFGAFLGPDLVAEAQLAFPPLVLTLELSLLGASSFFWVIALSSALSCWWIVSKRTRGWIWGFVDALLLGAFLLLSFVFPVPLSPASGDVMGLGFAVVRLAVTTAFAMRMVARFLPSALDLVERARFETLVAARLLRSGKSRFLTTIGALAILAVTFSSCALTTTLSVMGGFREDLKRKILGNTAHVVVDRESGLVEGWEPVLERVRATPGVAGASPYVGGEVMITSASNLSGAVLRGIDPAHVGDVTDLPRNIRRGRLEYLSRPELLDDLPAGDRRFGALGPHVRTPTEDAPDSNDTLDENLDELEELLGPPDAIRPRRPGFRDPSQTPVRDDLREFLLGDSDAPREPRLGPQREVLPGIIVGQELARSLRLFLGDEVNVVSPLGDIGPSGPIPKSRPFRVAGIFYSGMYEYDMKMAYVSLDVAQRFLGTGEGVTGIEIKVDDIDRAPDVASAIRRANGASSTLRVRDWQVLNQQLFGALALERLAMFVVLGIAIVVAGFCVFGTLTLMVQEKQREVAILKAMGSRSRAIVAVFLLEGVMIGAFGAVLGLGLGFVACFAAEHFAVPMSAEVYYIDKLPIHVDATEFALVGVSSVVVCLLATVFPAVFASRLEPVDALRYE